MTKYTHAAKDGPSVEAVDDQDPALEVHDHVRHGQVDHQLVAGGPDVRKPLRTLTNSLQCGKALFLFNQLHKNENIVRT
jgi:hypothetical protein